MNDHEGAPAHTTKVRTNENVATDKGRAAA